MRSTSKRPMACNAKERFCAGDDRLQAGPRVSRRHGDHFAARRYARYASRHTRERAERDYLAGVIVAGMHTNEIFIENGRFYGKKRTADAAANLLR